MAQVRIKRDLFLPLNSSENPQKLNTCFKARIRRGKLYHYIICQIGQRSQSEIHTCRKKTWPLSSQIDGSGCPLRFISSTRIVLSFFGFSFFSWNFHHCFHPLNFSSHWCFGDSASGYCSLSVTESLSSQFSVLLLWETKYFYKVSSLKIFPCMSIITL